MDKEDLKLIAVIAVVIIATLYVNQKYAHVELYLPKI